MYPSRIPFDENPGAMHTASLHNLDPRNWIEHGTSYGDAGPSNSESNEWFGQVVWSRQEQYESCPNSTTYQYSQAHQMNINDPFSLSTRSSPMRTGTWSGTVGGCKALNPKFYGISTSLAKKSIERFALKGNGQTANRLREPLNPSPARTVMLIARCTAPD